MKKAVLPAIAENLRIGCFLSDCLRNERLLPASTSLRSFGGLGRKPAAIHASVVTIAWLSAPFLKILLVLLASGVGWTTAYVFLHACVAK